MRRLIIIGLVIAAGCGKGASNEKVKPILHCWEIGWQIIESCLATSRLDCGEMADSWFESTKPDVVVIDGNSRLDSEKQRCAKATGASVWNQLSGDDISDDMADALQALQTAVRSRDLPKIREARGRVRSILGM